MFLKKKTLLAKDHLIRKNHWNKSWRIYYRWIYPVCLLAKRTKLNNKIPGMNKNNIIETNLIVQKQLIQTQSQYKILTIQLKAKGILIHKKIPRNLRFKLTSVLRPFPSLRLTIKWIKSLFKVPISLNKVHQKLIKEWLQSIKEIYRHRKNHQHKCLSTSHQSIKRI